MQRPEFVEPFSRLPRLIPGNRAGKTSISARSHWEARAGDWRELVGDQSMPANSRNSSAYRALAAKGAILAAIAIAAIVLPAGSASAQNGIFAPLFGRRTSPSAHAYADPSPFN